VKSGTKRKSSSDATVHPKKSRNLTPEECLQLINSGMFGVKAKEGSHARRAEYWNFFHVVTDEAGENLPFVQCMKCSKVMNRATNAGNTQFEQHAQACVSTSSKQTTLDEFQRKTVNATSAQYKMFEYCGKKLLLIFVCRFL